jgi:catalase
MSCVRTIDKAVADTAEAERTLLFLPGQLTDRIEASSDPPIDVRDGDYAESFSRLSQQTRSRGDRAHLG